MEAVAGDPYDPARSPAADAWWWVERATFDFIMRTDRSIQTDDNGQSDANGQTDAGGLRLGIVVSRYHEEITDRLRDGAVACFSAAGGQGDDLVLAEAPGAFELPIVAAWLAERDDLDGVVALGCLLQGETSHMGHIAGSVAEGLMSISLRTGKPVAFGVLTCETLEQAMERAGGRHGNKGQEAMQATIETIRSIQRIGSSAPADASEAT